MPTGWQRRASDATSTRLIVSLSLNAREVLPGGIRVGFYTNEGPRPGVTRTRDRLFLDDGAEFGGEWTSLTGLTPEVLALHSWGPRDATLYVDSQFGSMSIVGHSQLSKRAGWPGLPKYSPAAIGISGFGINDVTIAPYGAALGRVCRCRAP